MSRRAVHRGPHHAAAARLLRAVVVCLALAGCGDSAPGDAFHYRLEAAC